MEEDNDHFKKFYIVLDPNHVYANLINYIILLFPFHCHFFTFIISFLYLCTFNFILNYS